MLTMGAALAMGVWAQTPDGSSAAMGPLTAVVAAKDGNACTASAKFELPLLPGEYWWGGATYAGREQPFSAATNCPGRRKDGSLAWDMRTWNYHSQIAPLLLSSKGRYVWCEEPFGFEQKEGVLTVKGNSELEA